MLIGITGKARSGKDTAANHLVKRRGFEPRPFAHPLKLAVEVLFDLPRDYVWDDAHKVQPLPGWPEVTMREAMQKLGTECMRNVFFEDFWLRRWLLSTRHLRGLDASIVVPDVRFDNEAKMITDLGGVVIRVTRRAAGLDGDAASHVSEAGVSDTYVSHFINNDGTLDELYRAIDKATA